MKPEYDDEELTILEASLAFLVVFCAAALNIYLIAACIKIAMVFI